MTPTLDETKLAEFARRAVDLSLEHVRGGGIPFSALVVGPSGKILGAGVNEVMEAKDPLAHAEIVAMRNAAGRLGRPWLSGGTLIASGEPCGLCYYAARHFNIDDIVYVVDRHEAARYGFDYVDSYRTFTVPPERWPRPSSRHLPLERGLEPFEAWRNPGAREHEERKP